MEIESAPASGERRAPGDSDGSETNGAHAADHGFTPVHHVYEPHRTALPPLGPYVRELWRRRQFAFELARTDLRSKHFNTVFGQLWLVLNALLLASIYFILVSILARGGRGIEFLAHLLAAMLTFRFVSGSVRQGARSVVGGGKLILNTAFPRALLPLSSVLTSFMSFLPTVVVYAILHAIAERPVGPHLLWLVPIFAILIVFASGAAMFFAAAQVYFRDLASFLPYFTRIWLYTSPILYYVHEVPDRFKPIIAANPLYPMLGAFSQVVDTGQAPGGQFLLAGLAWAVVTFVAGALFFVSREREFGVRL